MKTHHFIKNTSRGATKATTVSFYIDCANLSKMAFCQRLYNTPTGEYLFRPLLLQRFLALREVWQKKATTSKHPY
ncbi:hypothetical protein V5739_09330 [Salinimicrobium sp. TIG7-5_MAKvit]|uniref:hypothetical protein n=1 Tax=Salinimicrobium sp. TIG7-5_MAKvit TaxID=3121289 RepID=UPI003C6DEE34